MCYAERLVHSLKAPRCVLLLTPNSNSYDYAVLSFRVAAYGSRLRAHAVFRSKYVASHEGINRAWLYGPQWEMGMSRGGYRSEEHTSELQSQSKLVCRLPLE